jgi:hypothetical protein
MLFMDFAAGSLSRDKALRLTEKELSGRMTKEETNEVASADNTR